MSIRLYLCPVLGDGLSSDTAFRPGLEDIRKAQVTSGDALHCRRNLAIVGHDFFLVAMRLTDWTNADADSTLVKLFDSANLPDTITDWQSFKAFLQSKTVGNLTAAQRQAFNTKLTNFGFDTSQVTLSTTLWQVFVGMLNQMGYQANGDLLTLI